MTKKKEQPRDGNGKFAKIIKVEDKYGNAAYFTPEEMDGFKKATPTRNPDCEPATRGYVKGLLRRTKEHTHNLYWDGLVTMMSMFGGWLLTVMLGAGIMSGNSSARELGDKYFVVFLLFSIAVSCIFCEFLKVECKGVEEPTSPELKKYTPPRKDECEEG